MAEQQAPIEPTQRIVTVLRFNPEYLREYFARIKSSREFIEVFKQLASEKLSEWDVAVIESIWRSVIVGTTPLMEVYPVTSASAWLEAILNEIQILLVNAQSQLKNMFDKCLELYKELPEYTRLGEIGKFTYDIESCKSLTKFAPVVSVIVALYSLEFVRRKSQFSLPLDKMPNTAKGVVGLWT